ncbi:MAG TPA: M20/M25/M40 family metallo-hydrolase [Bryobacteraceae bacterium]|nr:M20/M25/M40 family metallo-hydrolase [Bryobacteraceae bacterium]
MKRLTILLFLGSWAVADTPPKTINPQVAEIVSQVSADRIAAIQQKLGSFGTRNIYSASDDPNHGIGAAREWIAAQLKSYSPRLEVSFDKHKLAKQGRAFKDVEIWNIVARLPGDSEPDEEVLLTAHYDSIHLVFKTGADGRRELDSVATAEAPAPGVTDDGSGIACIMELARIMSQYHFRKTIVFIGFAAEEYGLFGSGLYAEDAVARHEKIEAMFNNDIIGSDLSGNGASTNERVNVYSEEPNDSAPREVARYMREIGERYIPGFQVDLQFRHDRFGRGGDHSPFAAAGYGAIRITTPSENYANQHTATDTFANTAPAYTARVTQANAAAVASLALAPKAPALSTPHTFGFAASPIQRGPSGYDASLTWHSDPPEDDLAGYAIVMRKTTSPYWERQIFVGNVTKYVVPNINIDELVFGVRAIDKAGDESVVTPYVSPPYKQSKIATY